MHGVTEENLKKILILFSDEIDRRKSQNVYGPILPIKIDSPKDRAMLENLFNTGFPPALNVRLHGPRFGVFIISTSRLTKADIPSIIKAPHKNIWPSNSVLSYEDVKPRLKILPGQIWYQIDESVYPRTNRAYKLLLIDAVVGDFIFCRERYYNEHIVRNLKFYEQINNFRRLRTYFVDDLMKKYKLASGAFMAWEGFGSIDWGKVPFEAYEPAIRRCRMSLFDVSEIKPGELLTCRADGRYFPSGSTFLVLTKSESNGHIDLELLAPEGKYFFQEPKGKFPYFVRSSDEDHRLFLEEYNMRNPGVGLRGVKDIFDSEQKPKIQIADFGLGKILSKWFKKFYQK